MISIIVVTLNEESVISDTLESLKSLTLPHEIIVSDGKSSDRTAELARKYTDKVIVYNGTTRQTIAMGRNDGADSATGDFLVFLDADSRIIDPDTFFSQALKLFEVNPKLVGLTARLKVFSHLETFGDKIVFGILSMVIRFMNNVLNRGESTGEFQMIRATAFRQLNGFNPNLVTREDADMFLRLSKIGKTMLDPKLVVYHTGRRAHKIGWPKLLSIWFVNTIWFALFKKSKSDEWTVIR